MIEVPGCRLLIKPANIEDTDDVLKSAKRAGIQLLEQDERKQKASVDRGTVLKMGPKCSQDYIEGVEIGSLIGFAKFGGKFVRDLNSEEDMLIINDEDVICIFKEAQ